MKTTDTDL